MQWNARQLSVDASSSSDDRTGCSLSFENVRSHLGRAYEQLTGDAVLVRLFADRKFETIEALFRVGDPRLASQLLRPILGSNDACLVSLLADQLLTKTITDPFPKEFATGSFSGIPANNPVFGWQTVLATLTTALQLLKNTGRP